jgi:hypothetical protein
MPNMRKGLLQKEELLERLSIISHPKNHRLSQEALEQMVTDFCAGCPDPLQAYRVLFESTEALSDEEVVFRVLAAPVRAMTDVPDVIVPANHPTRLQH